jgi:uncharacterized integral membrane protein (TIGR02327 family)
MNQDSVNISIGTNGLIFIVITLLSIYLAWTLVQQIKFESILKHPGSPQAKIFQVVLSIIIGHEFAQFLLDYFNWSQMLKSFVE